MGQTMGQRTRGENMKIYKDGEYAKGKRCFICKTDKGVFYDKKSDFFLCNKCLYEEILGQRKERNKQR